MRSKKTQGIVTPKPLAEQPEKVPKKKRTAKETNKGSDPVLVDAVARKRTKRTGGAGGQ